VEERRSEVTDDRPCIESRRGFQNGCVLIQGKNMRGAVELREGAATEIVIVSSESLGLCLRWRQRW